MMKRNLQIFAFYWFPVIAWGSIIFYFSSMPNLSSGLEYDFFLRKCAHMTEFGIFAYLSWRTLNYHLTKSTLIYSFVFSLLFAITDELHQLFVPTRKSSPVDVLIDTAGIAIAIAIIWKSKKLSVVRTQ